MRVNLVRVCIACSKLVVTHVLCHTGQLQDMYAVQPCGQLENAKLNAIVRHEVRAVVWEVAGSTRWCAVVVWGRRPKRWVRSAPCSAASCWRAYATDSTVEVAETCQIALARLLWVKQQQQQQQQQGLPTPPPR